MNKKLIILALIVLSVVMYINIKPVDTNTYKVNTGHTAKI